MLFSKQSALKPADNGCVDAERAVLGGGSFKWTQHRTALMASVDSLPVSLLLTADCFRHNIAGSVHKQSRLLRDSLGTGVLHDSVVGTLNHVLQQLTHTNKCVT